MRPETAISNWRNWQSKPLCKPELIGPIGGGLSNRSFLLDASGCLMVLRINSNENTLPGIDREREAKVWRTASQAGIAPQLLHAEHAYFVSQYVSGESLATASSTDELVDQAIGLMRQCHSLDVDAANLDYTSHIQCYWDRIKGEAPAPLIQQKQAMLANLEALQSSQDNSVLCHHDPVKANFVGSTQQLFLIDWEYAAKGMAVMDYAALAVEWDLADQIVMDQTGFQPNELKQAKILYRYLCQLWTVT